MALEPEEAFEVVAQLSIGQVGGHDVIGGEQVEVHLKMFGYGDGHGIDTKFLPCDTSLIYLPDKGAVEPVIIERVYYE